MNKTIFNTMLILYKSVAKKFYKNKPFFLKCILTSLSIVLICSCASFGTENYESKEKIEANSYKEKENKEAESEKILKSFLSEKVVNIDTSVYQHIGNKNAPVTIVEFFDFLCPYCKDVSDVLDEVVRDNPDKVRLIYANYPMDITCNSFIRRKMHKGACLLAKGAICASEQNKFGTYHKLAFNIDKQPTSIKQLALKANLNTDKFQNCLQSVLTENVLHFQITEAMKLDLPGTPVIYINGREYKYKIDKEIIQKIIDKEIQKKSNKNN